MGYQEFAAWCEYARIKGGLHHADRLLATIAAQINRATGGDADPSDFLPALKINDADEKDADIGEVLNIFAMVAN